MSLSNPFFSVLGTVEYLLLDQPSHVAFSNGTVSVGFQNYEGNMTLKNTSILLIEASTNRTVARKELSPNPQAITVFECFHFKSAGNFWFKMASEIHNGTAIQWNRENVPLHVKWPVFHIDLKRTPAGSGSSLQLGLFTNEYLCPVNETLITMEVIQTSKLYELGLLISNESVGLRTSKKLYLSRSQWVTVDCHLLGQIAYITVLLKSTENHSVIASTGPVDLVRRFGYRLTVAQDMICEHSVVVSVVSPPCASTDGQIAVFKDSLGPPGQRMLKLYESIVDPKSNRIEFNCTLFDEGTNKYCFEFSYLGRTSFSSRAKECVLIQRNVGLYYL